MFVKTVKIIKRLDMYEKNNCINNLRKTLAICWSHIELSLQIIQAFLKRLFFGLTLRSWFYLIVN